MNFGEFKNLNYNDLLSLEDVLSDLLYKGAIDVPAIMNAYTTAIERERHKLNSQFNEATIVLAMGLSGNWRGMKRKNCKREQYIFST